MGASYSNLARRAVAVAPRAEPRLGGKLTQRQTNGKSVWGTLAAPLLPLFLTNNPLPNGAPWSRLDSSTNYYEESPNTGVIRSYDFVISRDTIAPDGYERPVLLVNGGFPGPLIEANWGDTIQVTVHNNMSAPEEGVALHWHGFLHHNAPWEDGVPAVTQCPIPPGESYTYSLHAELYGSTWYHSHYSAQYAGGLIGPMVIYGPGDDEYDIDLGPVMLSDWNHEDYFKLTEDVMAPNPTTRVTPDNNLINGKMNFDCAKVDAGDDTPCVNNAGVTRFQFERNKTHRLRLVNAGAQALQRFSIDGHTMKVIANDFVPIEPYETNVVTLGIGQRTDVIVNATGDLDSYWMRSNISTRCTGISAPLDAYAAIFYDDADITATPQSVAWDIPDPGTCTNDDLSLTHPKPPIELPTDFVDVELDVQLHKNETGHQLFWMNDVSFRGNYNSPTLLLSKVGNYSFDEEWNVINVGDAKSVRINMHNNNPVAHPMHLHGYNMYVLHEGPGEWDGTIVNSTNPQRRDVQMVRGNGHLVVQFDAEENPGVWPFHCHIAWHVSAGFMVQFLTKPDAIRDYSIPNTVAETCRQWGAWTDTNIPPQIDSGL